MANTNNTSAATKKVVYGPTEEAKAMPRLHFVADDRKWVGVGGEVMVIRSAGQRRRIKNKFEPIKNDKKQITGFRETFPEATPEQYEKIKFCHLVEAQ